MLVRLAHSGEADAVADVFIPSFRGLTFLPALHSDEETREWVKTVMFPGHEVWVAEADGRVIGFAAVQDDILGHIYVRPSDQGAGVGSALLSVVKQSRPAGFRLWVFQRNDGARRFYERHGLRLVRLTDGADNEEREPDALYEWAPEAVE